MVDDSEFSLVADQREALLDAVIDTLNQYVFPEIADKVQRAIQRHRQEDGYQDCAEATSLAHLLTQQMQDLSGDRQLKVHFSPQPLPHLSPTALPTPQELEAEKHLSSLRNFDINRVERLRGNIGYLELYGFEPPEFAGDTLAAAMTFLAHTQALIIDLRHNRGGSPGMVALLCSYLLPAYPAVHLNDVYWRPDETTHQWWTVSHVPAPRYEHPPVYILTSQATFSAAEEFAYNLQVLKRAVVIGEHTSGGQILVRDIVLATIFGCLFPWGDRSIP